MLEMTQDNITDRFLNGIIAIVNETHSEDVIKKVKFSFLDYIGVVLAGSSMTYEKLNKLRLLLDDKNSESSVLGEPFSLSLQNAVFFNGINSHILELDDGCRYGVTHPGGPLFSALLPVAFKYNVEWDRFVAGVLTGYETILRISTAIQPHHYNRGYHPTATCTPLGIAVGICVMLNLKYSTLKDAFSCACISAGGSLKAIENTSKIKAINAARAAELGLISYCVAEAGFSGPEDVLEGKTGFLNIMSSSYNPDILIRGNSDPLWISRVYCKLYASCRHTHGAIEGILRLRDYIGEDINEIEKIEINIYKGIKGKHDIFEIYGEESAKMSIPYSVAAALLYGSANDEVFKQSCIDNSMIHYLMGITTINEDESLTALLPNKRATDTIIYLKDGRKLNQYIEYPIGEPENPVEYEDLKKKFLYLIKKSGESREYGEEIISAIFTSKPDLINLSKILNKFGK